ncbi:MAG: hypothetical protein JHD07_22120 [Bradyrhizobium sp.]|uniref:hypothetical protein n=1 Tax=Bradyrhizobium sp. TaxID=376 RepID=UPI001A1A05D4|nr:hypothetical protein [Bradyrhizobium sp.]MBJ7405857.1 hypothetical protein [Bradyrhizobium sp.]
MKGKQLRSSRIVPRLVPAIALVVSVSLVGVSPVAAQSFTDRFKSLFGGKSDEPAQPTPAPAPGQPAEDEIDCPQVTVRSGASTYAVGASGKPAVGNEIRFQATISKMARECSRSSEGITARIGIQGRVIAGPAGAPATVEVPLRIAVVQGGIGEKVIASKAYRTTVQMADGGSVPFTFIAEDLTYPVPAAAVAENYIFYVGFDPQALSPEPKGRKKK